jgi:hypothetical protein
VTSSYAVLLSLRSTGTKIELKELNEKYVCDKHMKGEMRERSRLKPLATGRNSLQTVDKLANF